MPKELVRFADWQARLTCYLDRCREERFEYGTHDCALFACGAVKAITGEDFSEDFTGLYADKREAARMLREKKWETLSDATSLKLGEPVHPAQAGKGDIVFRGRGLSDKALGVCVGKYSWFVGETVGQILPDGTAIMRHGLVPIPTLSCVHAWKVGVVDG